MYHVSPLRIFWVPCSLLASLVAKYLLSHCILIGWPCLFVQLFHFLHYLLHVSLWVTSSERLSTPSLAVEWISQHHSTIYMPSHGEAHRAHSLSITEDQSLKDIPHSTVEASIKTHRNDTALLHKMKWNEILPSATIRMDLEGIMLSKISQTIKYDFIYVWKIWITKQMN